jgi:Mrp family chromosome partitioning ATPase/capsular polysaccharide biosynthesis protein
MRSRFWLHVGIGAVVGAGVGIAVLAATRPVYSAAASVLVESVGSDVNMQTEAQLVRSTQTAADANARLAGASGDLDDGGLVGVEAVSGTSVLVIRYEAGTAVAAQAGAMAFAEAYLAARAGTARAALNEQIASLRQRLDDVTNQLGEVNDLIARTPMNDPELTTLRAEQTTLTAQSASLSTRMDDLQTTTVNPGRIVSEAAMPSAPARPNRPVYLIVAAIAGALIGASSGLVRTRWSSRVQRGADLGRHEGIPLLADLELEAMATGTAPQHRSGRTFNRLRNEVVAALAPDDHTIIVTGAAPGASSMLVAANLAAAFARADTDVVLVGASVPELDSVEQTTTLAAIFDLADIPGLTDVLTGRTSLSRALQRAARSPRLRVVTPGGTASATGLLQSEGIRGVLGQLANKTRYVIVEAPSTASGADAQSLASVADVALLVVEAGRAHHTQVADAATQLNRVGTRLLGAVVVPRIGPENLPTGRNNHRTDGESHPPVDTEAWVGSPKDGFDVPTTKLETLTPRPTGTAPTTAPTNSAPNSAPPQPGVDGQPRGDADNSAPSASGG